MPSYIAPYGRNIAYTQRYMRLNSFARFFRMIPAPVRINGAAAAVFLAVTILVFWPGLFGGQVLTGNETQDMYPRFAWASRELGAGRIPLWSNQIAHGFPVFLDQTGGLAFPPFLALLRAVSWITAYHFLVALGFFLGTIAMFAFARALKISPGGAVFTALAFAFGSQQVFWGQEIAWAALIPLFPFLFLAVKRLAQGRNVWMLLGALGYAAGLQIGYIEEIFYVSLAGGAWAIFLDATQLRNTPSRTPLHAILGSATLRVLIMMLLGIAAVAWWLVPAMGLAQESTRAPGLSLEAATGGVAGLGDLFRIFYPSFAIPFNPFPLFGFSEDLRLFNGLLPWVFAIVSFRAVWQRHREARFFMFLGAWCLLLLIPFLPFWDMLHALPVFSMFRYAWKWGALFTFGLALIGGYGFDHLMQNGGFASVRGRRAARLIALLGIFGIGAIWIIAIFFSEPILAFAHQYFDAHFRAHFLGRDPVYYYRIIDRGYRQFVETLDLTRPGPLAALAGLVGLLIAGFLQRIRPQFLARAALILAVGASLTFAARDIFMYTPRSTITEAPKVVEFLAPRLGEFRVAAFLPHLSDIGVAYGIDIQDPLILGQIHREMLFPNYGLLYGIDSVWYNQLLHPRRHEYFFNALNRFGAMTREEIETINRAPLPELVERVVSELPAFRRASVRYLLSAIPLPTPFREAHRINDAAGFPVIIYEVPDPLPRFFFAKAVECISGSDSEIMSHVLDSPSVETVFLECTSPPPLLSEGMDDTLTVVSSAGGEARLEATVAGAGRWLIFQESYAHGWHAAIDGAPVDVVRANGIYQAVYVPSGQRQIAFMFTPRFALVYRLWHAMLR